MEASAPPPSPSSAPGAPPPAEPGPELIPAKFNERFIAYVIDYTPFVVGFYGCWYAVMIKAPSIAQTPQWEAMLMGGWVLACWLYQFLGNYTGGTIGKRFMAVHVVNRDGKPLGAFRSALRASFFFLSTPLNWGFLVALLHSENKAMHDIASGSLVVDSRPKNVAETGILFIGAVFLVIAMYGGMIVSTLTRETPSDRLAIARAEDGLTILAQIEEVYKEEHGTYTKSLQELATSSGDVDEFKSAMNELFDPNLYKLNAGTKRYHISAAALDRRRTMVTIKGP